MKIWVTASMTASWVCLHAKRPTLFFSRDLGYAGDYENMNRIGMKKLLKGTGKRLPRYGSKTILELDLIVRDDEDEGPQDGFSR